MENDIILTNLLDVIELSDLAEDRKTFFRESLLSMEQFLKIPLKDMAELLATAKTTIEKQEENIINSGNPAAISDLADSKEFIDDLFFDAESDVLKGLGAASGVDEATRAAQNFKMKAGQQVS